MAAVTVGIIYNSGGLFHPFIAEELGIPRARVAMFQTIQSLTGVVGLLVANKILDRVSLRKVMSLGVLLIGCGLMLNSAYHSIWFFYITFAVVGFFNPFMFSLVGPTMLTNWFRQRLGTVIGVAASMTGIGGALFNPAVAWSIQRFGWRNTYLYIGIFILITLLPLTLFVFKLKPSEGELPYGYIPQEGVPVEAAPVDGMTARAARRTPAFYLFFLVMAFLALPGNFMQQISPHVLTMGHSVTTSASVMSGVMLGIAGGKIVIGWLLDRLKAVYVLVGFGLIGMAGWLGLTASNWLGLAIFTEPFVLILCGFLAGSAHAISQVGVPLGVRTTFGVREYSRIFAVISAAMSLVGAVMPTLGSAIYDLTGSYVTPLTVTAFAYCVAVPCMLLALRLGKKAAEKAA